MEREEFADRDPDVKVWRDVAFRLDGELRDLLNAIKPHLYERFGSEMDRFYGPAQTVGEWGKDRTRDLINYLNAR